MKPFYTKQMLIEASTEDIQDCRIAVANEMEKWSDKNEDGTLVFPTQYHRWNVLYHQLSDILAAMPWKM